MKYFFFIVGVFLTGSLARAEVTQSYSEVLASVNNAEEGGFGDLLCNYPEQDSEHYADSVQSCQGRNGISAGQNRMCLITELRCQSPATGQFVIRDVTFFIGESEKCADVNPSKAFRDAFRLDGQVRILEGN